MHSTHGQDRFFKKRDFSYVLLVKFCVTHSLDVFRDGARSGNLRCMKDLADYGAKLGDRQSYIEGRKMLNDVIVKTKNHAERAKAQEYLAKLQQHNTNPFLN